MKIYAIRQHIILLCLILYKYAILATGFLCQNFLETAWFSASYKTNLSKLLRCCKLSRCTILHKYAVNMQNANLTICIKMQEIWIIMQIAKMLQIASATRCKKAQPPIIAGGSFNTYIRREASLKSLAIWYFGKPLRRTPPVYGELRKKNFWAPSRQGGGMPKKAWKNMRKRLFGIFMLKNILKNLLLTLCKNKV